MANKPQMMKADGTVNSKSSDKNYSRFGMIVTGAVVAIAVIVSAVSL